ncbi:MAG: ParA family protein [Flavobacterium sp.]|nr:ParA family protein [Flavobacterium sp.]
MKVISIITEKGGVGKTTTSVHLGASFSEKGFKTLLVDFDAQRNLSIGYKINKDFEYTVKDFLNGNLEDFALTQKKENLFILSGDRNLEDSIYSRNSLKKNLDLLEPLNFDYIIIDCPPRPITSRVGLGEIALFASDFVISPIEAEEYSIEGINELLPSIVRIKTEYNSKLEFLGFFFNKVLENTVNFRKYRKIALNEAGDAFLKNYIRQDVSIEKAKSLGETVFTVAPNSRASEDYFALVEEIIIKINTKL